jgi:hypothetical protein
VRTFLVPKESVEKPFHHERPKYLLEVGYHGSYMDAGDFYLVKSSSDDATLDKLRDMGDVVEIKNDAQPLSAQDKLDAQAVYDGKIQVEDKTTGRELIVSIGAGILSKQATDRVR